MSSKTTTTTKRDQSRTGKSLIALINYLESQLKSTDPAIATQAASDLKEIILSEAERRDRAAERAVRLKEAEARKALAAPAPVDRDLLIARLQKEVEAKKTA